MLWPISIALTSRATNTATTISSAPIPKVPTASHMGSPVAMVSSTAASASTRPAKAARSSPKITTNSACRLSWNQRHRLRAPRTRLTSCRQARIDIPSAPIANTSTPTAHHSFGMSMASCEDSLCQPS